MAKNKYPGVSQLPEGGWKYRIKMKLPDGRVVNTERKKDDNGNAFLTARAAYEAKKAHETSIRANPTENAPKRHKTTLQDVYDNYLSTEGQDRAVATITKQNSMWKNHVGPKFGDREIDSITIIELQTFLSDLYKEYSYKYTEGFLKFFYLLFGHADRMEVINPDRYLRMFVTKGKRLTMPKMTQADFEESEEGAEVYDDEHLLAMEKIFKSEDGNLLTAFYLGLYCGLRISECFALRWENINWEEGTITVNRQLHYEDGIWKLCAVKTLTSIRQVIMPAFLQDYLDGYFEQQRKEQSKLGQGYRNTEQVYDEVRGEWIVGGDFINRKSNGELLTNNSTKYWSKKIKAELGIEFKYHNLRHTYASTCAASNVNLQMLMTMMGHKKIDTTRRYYINTDNEPLKKRTAHILDGMFTYHSALPILDEPPADFVETIDSKGRRTKYRK